MPVTKGDKLIIMREGVVLESSDPDYEELEVIDYPVDISGKTTGMILLIKLRRPR